MDTIKILQQEVKILEEENTKLKHLKFKEMAGTTITFYCNNQQKEAIKNLAKEEGCSLSDYCLSKILNLTLQAQPETIEYKRRDYKPKKKKRL